MAEIRTYNIDSLGKPLGQEEKVSEHARRYLNRLSDLMFVAARLLNRHAGREDVQWRHQREKKPRGG